VADRSTTPSRTTAEAFKSRWWLFGAALGAAILTVADILSIVSPEPAAGPWYKQLFGAITLIGGPIVTFAGLIVRLRNRRVGGIMIAVGVAPGVAALVLFWSPPFLLFGSLSLAVMISAINDAQTPPAPQWTPSGSGHHDSGQHRV